MTVTIEISPKDLKYNLWSGAIDTLENLTDEEVETIVDMLEDICSSMEETMSLTELNDFFWFERDTIAEWLGYSSYDELMSRK